MKVFQAALILCISAGFIGGSIGFKIAESDIIYPEEVLQATSSCKEGDWVKIDRTTIYCADGAEYKRGE